MAKVFITRPFYQALRNNRSFKFKQPTFHDRECAKVKELASGMVEIELDELKQLDSQKTFRHCMLCILPGMEGYIYQKTAAELRAEEHDAFVDELNNMLRDTEYGIPNDEEKNGEFITIAKSPAEFKQRILDEAGNGVRDTNTLVFTYRNKRLELDWFPKNNQFRIVWREMNPSDYIDTNVSFKPEHFRALIAQAIKNPLNVTDAKEIERLREALLQF